MDPFQHTPWLIITSFTYQPALDSASGLESFTLQSTRYHGKAKRQQPPLWFQIPPRCPDNISKPTHAYDTAIQDTSWITRASEKHCLLSFLDDDQLFAHSRKKVQIGFECTPEQDIAVQKIRSPTKKSSRSRATFSKETKKQPFHFLVGFCS